MQNTLLISGVPKLEEVWGTLQYSCHPLSSCTSFIMVHLLKWTSSFADKRNFPQLLITYFTWTHRALLSAMETLIGCKEREESSVYPAAVYANCRLLSTQNSVHLWNGNPYSFWVLLSANKLFACLMGRCCWSISDVLLRYPGTAIGSATRLTTFLRVSMLPG